MTSVFTPHTSVFYRNSLVIDVVLGARGIVIMLVVLARIGTGERMDTIGIGVKRYDFILGT